MSKRRRFPRQSATNPRQLKAEGRIHHERKINVTLVGDNGRRETVQLTEAQLMEIMDHRNETATTVKAEAEDGTSVDLTVGNGNDGRMYGEGEGK